MGIRRQVIEFDYGDDGFQSIESLESFLKNSKVSSVRDSETLLSRVLPLKSINLFP